MKKLKVLVFALFTILFLGFSQTTAEAHAPNLHVGVSGEDVKELQTKLKKLGYFNTSATGYYGPVTKNAVIEFQRDFNVSATGFTGPLTRARLAEVDMMAHVVNGEARGESYTGQVAVASVILNRIDSSKFPNNTYNVIFQRNAFTAVNDGQYNYQPNASAYQAVKAAVKGSDPSLGATYYYNPRGVTDTWIFSRTTITKIGKHVFAK